MIITIVCPGPSCVEMLARRTFAPALVIAVNQAVEFIAHDWWVVGDAQPLHLYNADPACGLVHQFTNWREHLNEHNQGWADRIQPTHWDDLRCDERNPYGAPWAWSDLAAVALAAKMAGPTDTIEMIGADYAGEDTAPCNIATRETQRPDRWARQSADLDSVCEWLGITVTRHLPGGSVQHPANRQAHPNTRGRGRLPLGEQMARDAAPEAKVKDGVITCPTCSCEMRVYKTDAVQRLRYVICKKNGHKHTLRGA